MAAPAMQPGAVPVEQNRVAFFNITGRNGADPPMKVPNDQCIEAMNVDWYRSSLGRRRGGSDAISLSGGTAQTGVVSYIGSFVNSEDQGDREMWAVDDAATPRWKRLYQSTNWANVTVNDAVSSKPWDICGVEYNGKIHFFYDSTVNRSHVYDPVDGIVRRSGIAKGAAAPTTANAAGAVTDNRKYRARFTRQDGSGITIKRSEPSASTAVVPMTAQKTTVTRPTAPGEDETHWEMEVASDDDNYGTYYVMATTAIATTTADDNNATLSGDISDDPGTYTCMPSAKFGIADNKRLVMAGTWETTAGDAVTPSKRRVWWAPALGDLDISDDERIPVTADIKNYSDIDKPVTALSTPFNGNIYVFSYQTQWKMIGTNSVFAPYLFYKVAGGRGCIRHQTIIEAQDENGDAALYWLSPTGPYRYDSQGQHFIGNDIRDIWSTVNLSASTVVSHGIYHEDKHQIWWWVATGSSNEPDTKIVFDTQLGRVIEFGSVIKGWSKHTGPSAAARCSCMMSNTIAASMSRDLKPYVGYSTGTKILKCDIDSADDDDGTAFQSYLVSRPYTPWGIGRLGAITEEIVMVAQTHATANIQITVDVDMGARTDITSSVSLATVSNGAAETRVFPKWGANFPSQMNCFQLKVGDAIAVSVTPWNLDAVIGPVSPEQDR